MGACRLSIIARRRGIIATPAAGGGTDPSSFAGLQLWLDASDITPVADGTAIATWSDASGNANHVSNATAAEQPDYYATAMNGKPALRFTLGDFYATASTTAVDLPGAFSVFVVVKFSSVARAADQQNTIISKDYTRYEFTEYQSQQAGHIGGTSGPNSAASTLAAATPYILEWHRDAANAVTLRRNGTSTATGTNAGSATGGFALHIGARPGAGNALRLGADLAEVVIYNQFRSTAEQTDVRSHLATKYGITVA